MTNFSFFGEHDPLFLQLVRAAKQLVKDAQARVNHLTQSILAKAFRVAQTPAKWGRKKANA